MGLFDGIVDTIGDVINTVTEIEIFDNSVGDLVSDGVGILADYFVTNGAVANQTGDPLISGLGSVMGTIGNLLGGENWIPEELNAVVDAVAGAYGSGNMPDLGEIQTMFQGILQGGVDPMEAVNSLASGGIDVNAILQATGFMPTVTQQPYTPPVGKNPAYVVDPVYTEGGGYEQPSYGDPNDYGINQVNTIPPAIIVGEDGKKWYSWFTDLPIWVRVTIFGILIVGAGVWIALAVRGKKKNKWK